MASDTNPAYVERVLRERFGVVSYHRIAGTPTVDNYGLNELEDDPAPPEHGVTIYCVADNGAGKREVRHLYPTGAPVVVSTEP